MVVKELDETAQGTESGTAVKTGMCSTTQWCSRSWSAVGRFFASRTSMSATNFLASLDTCFHSDASNVYLPVFTFLKMSSSPRRPSYWEKNLIETYCAG